MDASEQMADHMRREMVRCIEHVEAGNELIAHFIGFNPEGRMFVMVTPWQDQAEKDEALSHVEMYFAWKEVTSYVMISEAWMVERSLESNDRTQPSECADRTEAIVAHGVWHGGSLGLHSRIVRDGKMVVCDLPVWQDGESSGPMLSLLPPEGIGAPPPHVARMFEALFAAFPQGTR